MLGGYATAVPMDVTIVGNTMNYVVFGGDPDDTMTLRIHVDEFDPLLPPTYQAPVSATWNINFSKHPETLQKTSMFGLVIGPDLTSAFPKTSSSQLTFRLWNNGFFDYDFRLNFSGTELFDPETGGLRYNTPIATAFGWRESFAGTSFTDEADAWMLHWRYGLDSLRLDTVSVPDSHSTLLALSCSLAVLLSLSQTQVLTRNLVGRAIAGR